MRTNGEWTVIPANTTDYTRVTDAGNVIQNGRRMPGKAEQAGGGVCADVLK